MNPLVMSGLFLVAGLFFGLLARKRLDDPLNDDFLPVREVGFWYFIATLLSLGMATYFFSRSVESYVTVAI